MNWPDDFINKIICGDCLETMRAMPDESIDMVMTSPPYWGLRDYGTGPDQLGLEPTPEMYIEHLTEIFNEAKRVLKKEGTLWLNIGDTYFAHGGSRGNKTCPGADTLRGNPFLKEVAPAFRADPKCGLQSKCLCMIPERLAWSLIQNGWILRNKNIWYKKNAMPSSVTDRFSNRWEYLFMFSKSTKSVYWTNKKTLKLATKQPAGIQGIKGEDWEWGRCPKCEGCGEIIYKEKPKNCSRCKGYGKIKISFWTGHDYYFDLDAVRQPYIEPLNRWGGPILDIPKKTKWKSDDEKAKWAMSVRIRQSRPNPAGKNPGDVFEINTQSFPEAHFAVFPESLCEKPIKAGCPEEVCKKCGKARERIIEKFVPSPADGLPKRKGKRYGESTGGGHGKTSILNMSDGDAYVKWKQDHPDKTTGWTACDCKAGYEPGIVLDPFAGAGTALFVAQQLKRRFIGIDIKKEYCELAEKRLAQGVL